MMLNDFKVSHWRLLFYEKGIINQTIKKKFLIRILRSQNY